MKKEREPKGTIGYQLKGIPIDTINDTLDAFQLKTQPLEHQARSLYLSLDQDTWLYALDMGLGKTKIGLDITTISEMLDGKGRALVTCPPMVTRQWKNEVHKHSNLSVTVVDSNLNSKEEKLTQLERSVSNITVASHPWLVSLFRWAQQDPIIEKHLKSLFQSFDILLVDEAHVLRNPDTKGFLGYKKYLLDIPKRYLMTGTPTGNNYTGVWALYYILDKGETFGTNYYKFLSYYFNAQDKGRYIKYLLKTEKRQQFMQMFWSKVIRWEESECKDLPGKTFTTLPVAMNNQQKAAYDELLTGAEDEAGVGPEFELMKITAGVEMKNSPKLEAVKALVEDICIENGKQFIVWCWLREESDYLLKNLSKSFKKLNIKAIKGQGGQAQKEEILNDWAAGKVDVLIANQKSLGVGIDLYEANTCCFFSNNRSLIDRKQAEKRIHRTGQKNHCTYVDLVCEETIDEINLEIVRKAKRSFSQLTKDSDLLTLLKKQRGK
jgi:SNF2 family DNA or RNA helicase